MSGDITAFLCGAGPGHDVGRDDDRWVDLQGLSGGWGDSCLSRSGRFHDYKANKFSFHGSPNAILKISFGEGMRIFSD